eukprot:m.359174 g.359174  ORF g.359174 m.359174 type:complete len:457 (-) comp18459_c0_seq1:299-1669(-)
MAEAVSDLANQVPLQMYEVGLVKFGDFKLRSGARSPVYFDLRMLVSNPGLSSSVLKLYAQQMKDAGIECDLVCGVAYTGIPLATVFSIQENIPMLYKRKEAKDYGTKKLVEGVYEKGQRVVLIDDVITTGGSLLETAEELERLGLVVAGMQVLIDRRPLDKRTSVLAGKYPLMCVFTMEAIFNSLSSQGVTIPPSLLPPPSFDARAALKGVHPKTAALMKLIAEKQTNLCLSADVTTSQELLTLADSVGPEICVLKTHIDMVDDFTPDVVSQLKALASKHNFMLFEDRKLADIGNTVQHQLCGGVYKIASWADFVTVHVVGGPGVFQAAAAANVECGLLALTQMSSAGNLMDDTYMSSATKLAMDFQDKGVVAGAVCQTKAAYLGPQFIHMTPGVNLDTSVDSLDQQYNTPQDLIVNGVADVLIVGRGIVKAPSPLAAAQQYRTAGWAAYTQKASL